MKKIALILLAGWLLPLKAQQPAGLKQGNWRGEFYTKLAVIPFQFEIKDNNAYFINNDEHAEIKNIRFSGDSVFFPIEIYDAVIAAKVSGDQLSGRFKKLSTEKPDTGIWVTAQFGKLPRFPSKGVSAAHSLAGKWEVKLITPRDTNVTVGLFSQSGSKITGTILTNSGDYRYFEGVADGNSFQLSAFSGSNPYLLDLAFTDENTIEGSFYTARGKTRLTGKRNEKAELPDPYHLTGLKEGVKKLSFSFPDLKNQKVSIADEKYKNKVVVVSILGSWCPNCLDEAAFLAPWYKKNAKRGVEIIGLAFERKNEFPYAQTQLNRLVNKFDVRYDILFAGQLGQENVSKALPELKSFFSFPTLIFIDKKGIVRQIHAGFNGPATGKYYEAFIDEFNREIDSLLAEK